MSAKRPMRAMLVALAGALCLMGVIASGANGAAFQGPPEITEFTSEPMSTPSSPVASPTQAGAHPNIRIFARFCDPPATPATTPQDV